jgi:hypothetical protein
MQKVIRYPVVLPVIAFLLYLAGSASFLGQWDSYDYLKQIVLHQLSALGFGRPVFLGYNIVLWESMKHMFRLRPQKVEAVVMMGMILAGVLGVLLFQALARRFLSSSASRMAALAFAVSPMYAIYSGFIMTEVPMLVALIAASLFLWKSGDRHPALKDALAGIFFGLAIGIREQALTLGPAFLWMLCSRDQTGRSRFRSILWFSGMAGTAMLVPVLSFFLLDPAGFMEHTRIWIHAIPMGRIQFWNNVQASLLWGVAICPAAWLAAAVAGISAIGKSRRNREPQFASELGIRTPIVGVFCGVVLPIMALWRDADVQMHPRYALVALPGSLIFCATIYDRWVRSRKGPVMWAVAHVFVFALAMAVLSPYRQAETEKMNFARMMRDAVPGEALIIAGSYSPIIDYFRGIGVRPEWRILWSGWGFNAASADDVVRNSWADHVPVYLSEEPLGWRYLESEYLHYYYFFKNCKKEQVAPKLLRVYPYE